MNLFSIFNKNWNSVFCFFGSLNEIDAIFASVNFDFRKIKIDKYWQWFNYTEEGFGEEDFVEKLTELIKKVSKKSLLIICLEEPFAKSTKTRLSVIRENPLIPIDNDDLENIILNLVWRLYDKERMYVAQQLKIPEWDVVLAEAKISEPKIDDKKILNPIGFRGKTMSFCLENTYLYYLFWETIKNILESGKGELLVCAEKNLLFDKNFSLINKGEKILLVNIGLYSTGVGIMGNYLNSFKHFNWGKINLEKVISKKLSVSDKIAKDLIRDYQENKLSKNAFDWFKKLLEKELKLLVEGIILVLKDVPQKENIETIYLSGELQEFPFLLELLEKQKWLQLTYGNKINIKFYPTSELIKDLNIEIINYNKNKISNTAIINLNSAFLINENKYEEMNKILKRRIKWLNKNLLKETNK